ncbi:MAG: hypothetical protein LBM93_12185 [Oscillospiraceae bacterium]|jgi:hypothetical protein|nr:hypothetical protein [Oscillospiraceae bacterium]
MDSYVSLPYEDQNEYINAVTAILQFNTRLSREVIFASILYVESCGVKIKKKEGKIRVQKKIWKRNRRADGIS